MSKVIFKGVFIFLCYFPRTNRLMNYCFVLLNLQEQAHKDHMLTTHNIGEYRYFCSECPKRFTNSAGLIAHRGIYHKISGAGNKTSNNEKL